MPAPLSVHDAIDRAWDESVPGVAWPENEEQTVDAVASVGTALEELCRELDEKKPRERDGAKLLWWDVAEQASQRDYHVPVFDLTLAQMTELFNKFLNQLKTAPKGAGGATSVVGADVAPIDAEDSDGIPD